MVSEIERFSFVPRFFFLMTTVEDGPEDGVVEEVEEDVRLDVEAESEEAGAWDVESLSDEESRLLALEAVGAGA